MFVVFNLVFLKINLIYILLEIISKINDLNIYIYFCKIKNINMYLEIKCLSYLLISSLSLNKFNLYIYVARITFIPFILIPFLFSLGKKKG